MSEKPRLLMVDDEPNILSAYRRSIGRVFTLVTAESGPKALAVMDDSSEFPVVVTDMRMPDMSGVEFVAKARKRHPGTVYIMLTGNSDQETAIDAINKGQVFRFLNKPCSAEMLEHTVKAAVKQYELIHAERTLLGRTLTGCVKLFMEAMAIADPNSGAATNQIRVNVKRLSDELGCGSSWQISMAASLSLLGSIAVPDSDEKSVMSDDYLEQVANSGSILLRHIPRMQVVADIVAAQREPGMLPPATGEPNNDYWVKLGGQLLRFTTDWCRAAFRENDDRTAGLAAIESGTETYDPLLFQAAQKVLERYAAEDNANKGVAPLTVTAKELRPQDLIQQDVVTLDNILLIRRGQELTPMMVERIRGFDKASLLPQGEFKVLRPKRKVIVGDAA